MSVDVRKLLGRIEHIQASRDSCSQAGRYPTLIPCFKKSLSPLCRNDLIINVSGETLKVSISSSHQPRKIQHQRYAAIAQFRGAGHAIPAATMTAETPHQNFFVAFNRINNQS